MLLSVRLYKSLANWCLKLLNRRNYSFQASGPVEQISVNLDKKDRKKCRSKKSHKWSSHNLIWSWSFFLLSISLRPLLWFVFFSCLRVNLYWQIQTLDSTLKLLNHGALDSMDVYAHFACLFPSFSFFLVLFQLLLQELLVAFTETVVVVGEEIVSSFEACDCLSVFLGFLIADSQISKG